MKREFPLLLIGLGILLSIGAVSWLYVDEAKDGRASVRVPNQLAGLERSGYTVGSEAITEFERLHGKQFPVTSGAIAVYGNRQVTLWVAGGPSATVASQMVEAMQERIAEGNSPFAPVDETRDGNRTVYVLEGMGQKHYYFQSKNLVIWLAVEPGLADQVLKQTLEVFP